MNYCKKKLRKRIYPEKFYLLGILGATTYYLVSSGTFWAGLFSLTKALVWPMFLVLEFFRFLMN